MQSSAVVASYPGPSHSEASAVGVSLIHWPRDCRAVKILKLTHGSLSAKVVKLIYI